VLLVVGRATPLGAQDEEAPEHPVVKPMTGAVAGPRSTVVEFGRLTVSYRDGSQSVTREVEGRRWHLEYQLEDRSVSRDEILANYESEARRIGGEVLNRRTTRLLFRVTRPGAAVTWVRLDARAALGGAYVLEIVDEAALEISVEFDADALREALDRDGRVSLYGILFDVDRADLLPGSGRVLDNIATLLKADRALRLEVGGHTDTTGSAERNRELSRQRAEAVVAALALYGVDRARLIARGFGPDEPVGDNATEEGRSQNRRVELVRIEGE